ncbi:MAG: thermonuclease family protein [Verrucomicrobiota bacterium]|nr:thermonuclease family protein [Verrucomicrobiota bacterium]|tara:strand:- start:1171 stop:1650 length:480 start_codon:yes stop_codon:yes gene_type:complete
MMLKKLFFMITILFLFVLTANSNVLKGLVEYVTDGDTINVKSEDKIYVIRLYGIDAPEKNQPYGNKVTTFLKDKLESKQVTINYSSKDRYGRIIGKVYYDGIYINELLIKIGGAWHYKQYSNDVDLNTAEQSAKKNRLGIWNQELVIPPWEWRKGKRNK